MNIETVLEMLGAPIVPRRPLTDGTNPWEVVSYDPKMAGKLRYAKVLRAKGVTITCENPDCTNTKLVHPARARNTFACSVACSSKMWRERKAGRSDRTPEVVRHRMWEHTKQNRKETP